MEATFPLGRLFNLPRIVRAIVATTQPNQQSRARALDYERLEGRNLVVEGEMAGSVAIYREDGQCVFLDRASRGGLAQLAREMTSTEKGIVVYVDNAVKYGLSHQRSYMPGWISQDEQMRSADLVLVGGRAVEVKDLAHQTISRSAVDLLLG